MVTVACANSRPRSSVVANAVLVTDGALEEPWARLVARRTKPAVVALLAEDPRPISCGRTGKATAFTGAADTLVALSVVIAHLPIHFRAALRARWGIVVGDTVITGRLAPVASGGVEVTCAEAGATSSLAADTVVVTGQASSWATSSACGPVEPESALVARRAVPETGCCGAVAIARDFGIATATVATALESLRERALLGAGGSKPGGVADVTDRATVEALLEARSTFANPDFVADPVATADVLN